MNILGLGTEDHIKRMAKAANQEEVSWRAEHAKAQAYYGIHIVPRPWHLKLRIRIGQAIVRLGWWIDGDPFHRG